MAGSGHSYNPLVATDGTLICLDQLQGIEKIDASALEVTVWAGTRLRTLNQLLWDEGFALINLGDTDAQTVAGAISTSTHGSGLSLGSLSTQVRGLTLLTPDGHLLECSESHDPDIFKAAAVSLGSLGIIVKVRLAILRRYHLRMVRGNHDLETALADIERTIQQHRHHEFWYWPGTSRVNSRTSDMTDAPANYTPLARWIETILGENIALWTLCKLVQALPALSRLIMGLSAALSPEYEKVDHSYRVLATPRYVRATEMEYAVSWQVGPDCLREIAGFVATSRFPLAVPIQYRYVAADDLYLSPYYHRASAMIDIQQYADLPNETYFTGAEKILMKYEGRPHWGKIHSRAAEDLRPLYPMWDRFHEIRHRLDPDGVFMNPYLRHLFGD